jgi:pilus assembly protein CpaF
VTVYERLRQQLLGLLDVERVDAAEEPDRVRALVRRVVAEYQQAVELRGEPRLHDAGGMVERLVASVTAYGPLTEVLTSPSVEEIFIEGERVTWLDRQGRLHGLDQPTTEEENRAVVDRLLAPTTRSLDTRSPLVQARVLDGAARLSAAIAPVAEGLSATIRRHAARRHTLDSLVRSDALSPGAAALLRLVAQGWSSVLVSGPPGAGKTSLLTALLAAVPASRCVRVCEEVRELDVPLALGSSYETRPPSASGEAAITLRDLVRFCLGMRTELLVVGEVRGAEAFELTRAANAGCGFACSVHANSAVDALEALTNAAIMAGEHVPERLVRKVFAGAIDLVVHLDLHDRGDGLRRREVREVVAVMPSAGDAFATEPLFVRAGHGAPLEWTGVVPPGLQRFERLLPDGRSLRDLLSGRADAEPAAPPPAPAAVRRGPSAATAADGLSAAAGRWLALPGEPVAVPDVTAGGPR